MDCGYARVSTGSQSLDAQMDALNAFGCERLWSEKVGGASGKQEQLASLIDYQRPGDRFVITKLDRAGRTVKGLIDTVQEIEAKGAAFVSMGDAIDGRDMAICMSHVNSYRRKSLDWFSPIELAMVVLPVGLTEALGIERVDPEDVNLTPYLVPHAMVKK